jgi:glutamate racemase
MKIGIFDSGVGGLTILKELYKVFPNCDYTYIGDNKNCPYGDKTKEQLFNYAARIIDYFINNDIKLVVIGCNTICSNVFDKLKEKYKDINLIGVIDATINNFINTNSKNVLVIGTVGTINSNVYENKIKEKNRNIKVYSLSTPDLVPMIENEIDTEYKLNEYLRPYNDVDSIILGCTHYKLIEDKIKNVNVVNSSDGVIEEIKPFIKYSNEKSIKIYTTGDLKPFNKLCYKIMNMEAEKINI